MSIAISPLKRSEAGCEPARPKPSSRVGDLATDIQQRAMRSRRIKSAVRWGLALAIGVQLMMLWHLAGRPYPSISILWPGC